MRTSKMGCLLVAACVGAFGQQAARAEGSEQNLPGAWECYGPGQTAAHTPPIVYFSPVRAEAGGRPATLYVDGFARAVNGEASLAADGDRIRVGVASAELVISGLNGTGAARQMNLTRAGGASYRCYRLPWVESTAASQPAQPAPEPAAGGEPKAEGVYYPVRRTYEPSKVPGMN
jgi:hypothetical protein